jgi:chemotaxis response regulator CheB
MISVLVVDDHSFVRAQVTGVLHGADGIEVVGECADGAEVVNMAALVRPAMVRPAMVRPDVVRPDVVLMDLRMPIVSGPTATRDLLAGQPASRVVMLTGWPAPAWWPNLPRRARSGFWSRVMTRTD